MKRRSNSELSKRELEVLRMMAAQKANKQIGADLRITEGSVKIHVHHILLKLNASTRRDAVAEALKRAVL